MALQKKETKKAIVSQVNTALEFAVLGTILVSPDSLSLASQHLAPNWEHHWHDTKTKDIANAIIELNKHQIKPDYKAVERALKKSNKSSAVKLLPDILKEAETAQILESRAKELQLQTQHRMMQTVLSKGVDELDASNDFSTFYYHFKTNFTQICPANIYASKADEIADEITKRYFDKKKDPDTLTGIPTGFNFIDKAMLGLQFGRYNILGARPSHGKSAIAGQIALTAAECGFPVLIFSHEMTKDQFIQRMACNVANVSLSILQMGSFNMGTEKRFIDAISHIKQLPIYIVDEYATPEGYAAYARYMRQVWGRQGLIIIDYIQLESLENWQGSRNDEICRINRLWLQCFKETGCSSLVLAQMNRKSAGKAPELSELRDSGSLEQDAYSCLLWWRPGKDDPLKPANQGILNLAKNRDGRLARQYLHFTGYSQKFDAWNKDFHQEMTQELMEQNEREMTMPQHYKYYRDENKGDTDNATD